MAEYADTIQRSTVGNMLAGLWDPTRLLDANVALAKG